MTFFRQSCVKHDRIAIFRNSFINSISTDVMIHSGVTTILNILQDPAFLNLSDLVINIYCNDQLHQVK